MVGAKEHRHVRDIDKRLIAAFKPFCFSDVLYFF